MVLGIMKKTYVWDFLVSLLENSIFVSIYLTILREKLRALENLKIKAVKSLRTEFDYKEEIERDDS